MPSLHHREDRHTVIDRRAGEYICFPDVACAADGTLIVAYNEAEQHVAPKRRALLVRTSKDNGRTWGDILRMDDPRSHCPRLTRLTDDSILLTGSGRYFHLSRDNGSTWESWEATGIEHDMMDRIVELGDGVWLTTGHTHRGTAPQPAIRQAPAEQMVYRSEDGGKTWQPLSVIARERNLVLCEASMCLLPDGRLLALLRENSFVYEPMYCCISDDEGETWSDPIPTPLIGHRPTLGHAPDGDLLVTYRDVSPDPANRAWKGTLDELLSGFRVHGRHVDENNPSLSPDGLRVTNGEGGDGVVRYALRPITDPRFATAVLEAEVRVDEASANGCGLRLGAWWRLGPDTITPDVEDASPVAIQPGCFNTIRLEYARGKVDLFVNGEHRASVGVESDHANARPILFGAPYPFEDNEVDCTWKQVRLNIDEPRLGRQYAWQWKSAEGLPDQWITDNALELQNARETALPDFGYTGWVVMSDDTIFCAYHHADGTDEGYDPMFTSYVMGTRFAADDFK